MPPRKAATRSSSRGQTILSFKTPAKITKSTTPHSGIKKDLTSSIEKQATPPPPPTLSGTVDVVLPASPQQPIKIEPATQTEEECIAASFDDSSIHAYYKQHILGARLVSPVHQEELPLEEKVLRHFDMSLQYGPCIGISRVARWKRAEGLGMSPPIGVFAVCLKVEREMGKPGGKEKEGNSGEVIGSEKRDTRRSYLDDYLSTRTLKE